ncbi:NAD-dependent epimerase/dehydratase family protein [Nocardioides marmoraquaticus]
MRVVVIGGSGHVGTHLVPRLVRAGHEVVNVSRGARRAYTPDPTWDEVEQVVADREALDASGDFGTTVRDLRPEAVVDLICFTVASSTALLDALRGRAEHLVHVGTLWRYGPSTYSPIVEGFGAPPVGEYGIAKEAIARQLQHETASGGLVTTSVHPGHIVGEGWDPINPVGNLDHRVWATLAAGEPLRVPGSGAEHMHHVHADDVAQVVELALTHRDVAAGEDFHAVAPTALTVSGYAATAAGWWGRDARLERVSWEEFGRGLDPELVEASRGHLLRNHCLSIEKGRRLLGYAPAYEPDAAVLESLQWLVDHDRLDLPRPQGCARG